MATTPTTATSPPTTAHLFQVRDRDGLPVGQPMRLSAAQRAADRLNLRYGAHRYNVRQVA